MRRQASISCLSSSIDNREIVEGRGIRRGWAKTAATTSFDRSVGSGLTFVVREGATETGLCEVLGRKAIRIPAEIMQALASKIALPLSLPRKNGKGKRGIWLVVFVFE